MLEWNTHKIRSTRNSRSPIGRPLMMFQVPSLYGAANYLVPVPSNLINCLDEECVFLGTSCNKDVEDLCQELVLENNYNSSCNDPYDAVKLYVNLREIVYNALSL